MATIWLSKLNLPLNQCASCGWLRLAVQRNGDKYGAVPLALLSAVFSVLKKKKSLKAFKFNSEITGILSECGPALVYFIHLRTECSYSSVFKE